MPCKLQLDSLLGHGCYNLWTPWLNTWIDFVFFSSAMNNTHCLFVCLLLVVVVHRDVFHPLFFDHPRLLEEWWKDFDSIFIMVWFSFHYICSLTLTYFFFVIFGGKRKEIGYKLDHWWSTTLSSDFSFFRLFNTSIIYNRFCYGYLPLLNKIELQKNSSSLKEILDHFILLKAWNYLVFFSSIVCGG